jgi:hypothetical protein
MIFVAIGVVAFVCMWATWEFLVWRSQGLRTVRPGAAADVIPFEERPLARRPAANGPRTATTLEDLFQAQDVGTTVDWLRVGDDVLEAVEQLTHGTIDNGLDLSTAFADNGHQPSTLDEQLDDAGPVIAAANWTWAREVVPAIEKELATISRDLAGQLESAVGRAAAALADAEGTFRARSAAALRHALVRIGARLHPLAFMAARRRRIWISQATRALAQDDAWATLDVLCARVHHDEVTPPIAEWSLARARALAELMEAGRRIEQEVRSTRTNAFLCLNADRQRMDAWVTENLPRVPEPSL